jgi:co-chaperonin GroES (HSP10)
MGCGRELIVADMLTIIGPYIMVEPLVQEVKSKVGLIIPATCWRVWRIGKVVRLGEKSVYWSSGGGRRNSFGQQVIDVPKGRNYSRPDVNVGDIVMFQNLAVREVNAGCNRYFLIHYDDAEFRVDSLDSVQPA